MRETFLFVETEHELAPHSGSDIKSTFEVIFARGVVVRTAEMFGSAVIIGEQIITSLFLVRNSTKVKISFSKGKQMSAFVGARDTRNNLAKLHPAEVGRMDDPDNLFGKFVRQLAPHKIVIAGPREIGDSLLVQNSRSGAPKLKVANMEYGLRVAERWEDVWKIDPTSPRGVMGSAVWNVKGELKGLSLAAMVPPPEYLRKAAEQGIEKNTGKSPIPKRSCGPLVYAIPASVVLDFAETK